MCQQPKKLLNDFSIAVRMMILAGGVGGLAYVMFSCWICLRGIDKELDLEVNILELC